MESFIHNFIKKSTQFYDSVSILISKTAYEIVWSEQKLYTILSYSLNLYTLLLWQLFPIDSTLYNFS